MELTKIPGLKKAVRRAEEAADEARDFAFTDLPTRICCFDALQLTGRHLLLLFAVSSPFVFGGPRSAEHVAQFLWIVSPQFSGTDREARNCFVRRCGRLKYLAACRAIERYLERALMDRPPSGSGAKRSAIVSVFANIVHDVAKAYGWRDDYILGLPIARVFQYLRRITQDEDPKAVFVNPADKVRRKFVRRYLDKKAARQAKRKGAK